jgi:hypothetical protein
MGLRGCLRLPRRLLRRLLRLTDLHLYLLALRLVFRVRNHRMDLRWYRPTRPR